MPFNAPFMLGPFTVDADGGLSPTTPENFPCFRFAWNRRAVQARLGPAENGAALVLRTVIGRVASTGRQQGASSEPRQGAFATLRALPPLLANGWTVGLTADHRIAVEAQVPLALPTRAVDLLTELTLFAMRLAPYLDLFSEGVEPVGPDAADPVGNMNTCPG